MYYVSRVMSRGVISVLVFVNMCIVCSETLQNVEEDSETTSYNDNHVLSTEETIFYYPKTDSGNKVKRHVMEFGWDSGGSDPTESSVVMSKLDRPIDYYQEQTRVKHVSYRDVGGIPYPSTSPKYPPQIPSYAPPSRTGFFTPPLPPEYLNPFADKPTLRGSNSESNSQNPRRPIPPPPVFRPFENSKDRVPLPPPDLMVPENKPSTGKKALNTPSRPNSHQTLENAYKDMLNNNNKEQSRPINETDFDFVPILQYPSVSRILSGSSGRRHEMTDNVDRHSGPNSRHNHHNFEHMAKNLPNLRQEYVPPKSVIPDIVRQPVKTEKPVINKTTLVVPEDNDDPVDEIVKVNQTIVDTKTTQQIVNYISNKSVVDVSIPQQEPPTEDDSIPNVIQDSNLQKMNDKGPIYLWGIAWDIHVYLIASLFTLLSVYAVYNLIILKFYKHLLSYPYFISIHIIITVIGLLRAVYLFHDAYNIMHSYPEPISHLMLNITCPLITTSFGILFLFLVKMTEVNILINLFKHPVFLIIVSLIHLGLCICLDLTTDLQFDESGTKYLPLVCQCVYILFCVLLGASYLYIYKSLSNSASRKQIEMFGTLYTTTSDLNKTPPDALSFCIRITLAAAMLILLMAVVQLYGIFGVPLYGSYSFLKPHDQNMQRWIWWAYQFSVRVIEIAICFLITWASTQRLNEIDEKETNSQNSTTGFALFPCGPCRNADEPVDDIYPAVCNTNQAIHNYSLRTGKKVYDDAFPLNNMHTNDFSNSNFEFQENTLPTSTYERRKTKRQHSNVPWHLNANQSNNYDEIGPGSEIIEIKDALTRKGLANLNRSDSDTSHNSHIPAHVSYESIGYHSANRGGIENNHYDDKDSNSEHGSSLSKQDDCDSTRGSFTTGHKKLRSDKNYVRKSGTLSSFSHNEKRKLRDIQTLREGKDRNSPNSMLVDEDGFVRFRSIAAEPNDPRRSAQNKRSLPRRNINDERSSR